MTINIASLQKSALKMLCSQNGMTTRVECTTYRRQKMKSLKIISTSSKVLRNVTRRFQGISLNQISSTMTFHKHFLTGHTNKEQIGKNLSVICKGSLTIRNSSSSSQTQLFTPPMMLTISERQTLERKVFVCFLRLTNATHCATTLASIYKILQIINFIV